MNANRTTGTANTPRHSWFPRRSFLKASLFGLLGLEVNAVLGGLRAEGIAKSPVKSCIFVFFYGGPSQLDTWDMKPEAPREVRGPFSSIATNVPGLRLCEHMPMTARVMDRLAVIRTMHHPMTNHNAAAVEAFCGRTPLKGDLELLANDSSTDFPCFGSALQYVKPREGSVPSHIALPHVLHNVVVLPGQTAGFLGARFNPLQITRDPNDSGFGLGGLELPIELTPDRLEDRRSLARSMNSSLREADRRSAGGMLDHYTDRAFSLLRSASVRRAFDIATEEPRVRDRYGRTTLGQSLLLARRLVEADVRFISVHDKIHNGQLANWDSHENNFDRLKDDLLPPADRGFSALIEDLSARGLLESTLVVAMGEFGRTPKINPGSGRDHWPNCYSVILAGGGIRGGTTFGTSDRLAAYPDSDGVTPGDLAATIFDRFGIDPKTEIRDASGRPYHLADGEPLRRLYMWETPIAEIMLIARVSVGAISESVVSQAR
jgi:hypothetical protein